ncbi:MBL fold metallo-hydrolase [Chloroflexota bacterium]
MEVELLGAHMTEMAGAKMSSLVIDEIIALDAGSICSSLPLSAQQKLKAVLLTHHHYDHVRDIPTIAMNLSYLGVLEVYSTPLVFEILSTYLLDGKMYPNFIKWPEEQPAIRFTTIEPYETINIAGYNVLAIPVPHSVPTVGFQVTSPQGKRLFYTGDTGVGLSECWKHVSPDLLITEISLPQKMEDWARKVGHLTPHLLKTELLKFRQIKGYLPTTLVVHLNPSHESEIQTEVAEVARELEADITLGREGMKLHL